MQIERRFSGAGWISSLGRMLPAAVIRSGAAWLLERRWFMRHVVLNRWFLHC
jgi:hypothetical protein